MGEPTNSGNLVFLRQDEAVMTGDKWRIYAEINVTGFELGLKELRQGIWRLQAAIRRTEELAVFDEELGRTERLINLAEEGAERLYTLLPSRRGRRGLVNLGGTIIKYLFGTPDANDLETLQGDLDTVLRERGELVHLGEAQVTLTRQLAMRAREDSQRVSQVADAVREVVERNTEFLRNLGSNFTHTIHTLNGTLSIAAGLRALELATVEYLFSYQSVVRGIESLLRGEFGQDLVKPGELEDLLIKINNHLPAGLTLLAGTDLEGVQQYYKVTRVQAISTRHGIVAVLDLPLLAPDQRMLLYEIAERPVMESVTQRLVLARTESRYLLVSPSNTTYALLQDRHMRECRPGTLTVCPAHTPAYRITTPSCAIGQYLDNQTMVLQVCHWEVAINGTPPTWIWDRHMEEWLFSLPQPAKVHVLCRKNGGMQAEEKLLEGSGRLRLPEGCTLWAPEYRLWPLADDGNLTTVRNWTWPGLEFRDQVKLVAEDSVDTRDVAAALEKLRSVSRPMASGGKELWVAWSEVEYHIRTLQEERQARPYRWGVGTAAVVLVALGIAAVAVRRHGRRRRAPETGGGDGELEPTTASADSAPVPAIRYPEGYRPKVKSGVLTGSATLSELGEV